MSGFFGDSTIEAVKGWIRFRISANVVRITTGDRGGWEKTRICRRASSTVMNDLLKGSSFAGSVSYSKLEKDLSGWNLDEK